MRRPFIAGNWKMHKTIAEAVDFSQKLCKQAQQFTGGKDILIAPPFTALSSVAKVIEGTGIHLAAQNTHESPQGAFTGEVSSSMAAEAGCDYVLIGHSERRHLYGETDDLLARKVEAAWKSGLKVIFCIGETLDEREQGKTFAVVEKQIKEGLKAFKEDDIERLVIAYEPVWAIGTGKTATPEQAEEVHALIRGLQKKLHGAAAADSLIILYGGSVKPDNMTELMAKENVDGALIGGASLDVESFLQMIMFDKPE
ncbi:MAG: triose-phosphate isomerase [Syntrophobacterales bacterium]|jgi:triosephosphate isomerase|nr:triose-phosphate isomerase [Syntrophobacterales bacterium]